MVTGRRETEGLNQELCVQVDSHFKLVFQTGVSLQNLRRKEDTVASKVNILCYIVM